MKREVIYELDSLYRGDFEIEAFTFGSGNKETHPEKSIAIMGTMRGDEIQQLYIASRLVHSLQRLEDAGLIDPGAEIRVIPCGNPFSLNTNTRFWAVDNTDINRMFPGYDKGETTQRIAAGIFDALKGYSYGVQLASYYLPGHFVPHARMMDMPGADITLASKFGLPYVIIREPDPLDSGTLNYNWHIWDTQAVSIHSRMRTHLDTRAAQEVIFAILRFMTNLGIIKYDLHGGYISTVVKEDHLVDVIAHDSGLLEHHVQVGDHVETGQAIASIYDPLTGDLRSTIEAPSMGVIFFAHDIPLATQDAVIYRIIDDKIIED